MSNRQQLLLGENVDTAFIQQALLHWFDVYQRDLPWRRTYDPYQIWISEIMGQQTQMDRVVDYFNRWISQFPDIAAVAKASEQELIKAWEGLGYYSRVHNLRRSAHQMMHDHGGQVPEDYAQLLALPGIGPYTAAAVLSIGFNRPLPLLDANVERLFARLDNIGTPIKHKAARVRLTAMADHLLCRENPRAFNQALMEFGALVCTPKKPGCDRCPLQSACTAYAADTVEFRPVPQKKGQRIDILMSCAIVVDKGRYYIQQRLPDDIWGGLWEFPGGRLLEGESPLEGAEREVREETEFAITGIQFFQSVVHHYTRYRVTLHGFLCCLKNQSPIPVLHAATQFRWVTLDELAAYPFPSGHRQLIAALSHNDPSKKS